MNKKILVACGSGVCTSTVAIQKIRELCESKKINVTIGQCTIAEVVVKQDQYDVIVTTAKYNGALVKPHIYGAAFVTGVGEKKAVEQLLSVLEQKE